MCGFHWSNEKDPGDDPLHRNWHRRDVHSLSTPAPAEDSAAGNAVCRSADAAHLTSADVHRIRHRTWLQIRNATDDLDL